MAEISAEMAKVTDKGFVRHHPWHPLEAHETLEGVKKYFPGEEIKNVDVSLIEYW